MDPQQVSSISPVSSKVNESSTLHPLKLWIPVSLLVGAGLTLLLVHFIPELFKYSGQIESNIPNNNENTIPVDSKVQEDNSASKKVVSLKPETEQWYAEEEFTGLVGLHYYPSSDEPSILISMSNISSGAIIRRSRIDSLSQLILSQDAILEFSIPHMGFPKRLILIGSVLTKNNKTLYKVRTDEGKGKIFYVRDVTNDGFCEDDNLSKLDPPCGFSQMDGLYISCIAEGDGEGLCDSTMKTYNRVYRLDSQGI